jgi:uncharacterized protein YjbJ (UPF0337 family)
VTLTNKNKAKNVGEMIKGRFKRAAGKSTGNAQLETEGDVDLAKGKLKQAGENVRDAVQE